MSLLSGITSTTTAANRCKVKVSSTDPICGYLADKLKAGTNTTLGVTSDATYGQRIEITATPAAFTESYKVKVVAGDTADYLAAKITATSPIVAASTGTAVNIAYTGALTNQKDVDAAMTPAARDIFTRNGGNTKWTSDDFAVRTAVWTEADGSTATLSTDYVIKKYIDDLDWNEPMGTTGRMFRTQFVNAGDVNFSQILVGAGTAVSAITTVQLFEGATSVVAATATTANCTVTMGGQGRLATITTGESSAGTFTNSSYLSLGFSFNVDEDWEGEATALEIYGAMGVAEAAGTTIVRCDIKAYSVGDHYTAMTTILDGTDDLGTLRFYDAADVRHLTRNVVTIDAAGLAAIAGRDRLLVTLIPYVSGAATKCSDGVVHTATSSSLLFSHARLVYKTPHPRLRVVDYA